MIVISSGLLDIPSRIDYIHKNTHDFPLTHKLYSCNSTKELKEIHSLIVKTNPPLQTQQDLYAELVSVCASFSPVTDLSYIYSLFLQLLNPGISIYNAVIKCCTGVRSDESSLLALFLYRGLIEDGLVGDNYTFPSVLKSCAQLYSLREGQTVHAHVIKNGFVLNLYVANTLMRFYGICGVVEAVRKVFDGSHQRDLVSWTVLIQCYVDNGFRIEGVNMFFDMCKDGVRADEKLMAVMISACARLGDISLGKRLHDYMCDHGVKFDVFIGNALVDMYLKCGHSEFAYLVFNQMPVKNVVSWNSMISGLAQSGKYKEALSVFRKMCTKGIEPDKVTLVGILNCCANLGVMEFGEWVHAYIDRNRIEVVGYIANALIDMYAKCGSLDVALKVFEGIKCRDVYSYSTMIMGLAMHGYGEMALDLFKEMNESGIEPNEVTFVGVLAACCHTGLVDQGYKYFSDMSNLYNLKPGAEHYGCMVDLLARASLTSEAYKFAKNMPIEADKLIWGSLMGACRIHGNLELAEIVMKKLVEVEPEKDGAYVLMSNIYASKKKWKNVLELRKGMKEGKIRKSPGCSSIELDGVVHEFRKGDKTHSNAKEIYMLLNTMIYHLYDTDCMVDNCEFFDMKVG